ncbi:PQQ-dependent sugar dehydrogenase [Solirubrobacter sp. CPCC 204708]|uniref:PQQ-dependent sugar dehydrogenase n=1 Tax=Solirubrobacter deserti TaxID=2282478 RepID=A0ABT4RPR4_9ACTN|nr:PQQ-dependent sugar dehydrogenase [Solirubrobacter deserti]MBE2316655.1 PQQ-dependent sugar dehydrogenase [Solirubrobacter deserti]MDA0140553.1 PQQ-dependent sugar dehydrogenase [Solirubrobacter deserti]
MRRKAIAAVVMAVGCVGIPAAAQAQTPSPTPTPQPGAERFEKLTLNDFPGEPMNLAVLPDSRVLHTARTGEVRIHDPKTGRNVLAATIEVYQHDEEGLQSVAVNPFTFEDDKWVYAYYSPPLNTPADNPDTPGFNEGDAPDNGTAADWQRFKGVIRLSRYKLKGNRLDLKTEQKIIDVPVDRGQCCHVGGNIEFDAAGNLYLSTGDDTNPFFSDGYSPLDDSPGRNPVYDARRSAGNTNDLRGKILRIKPKRNKPGYTVPDGNLFKKNRDKTRPEIYAMGLRNPFRFGIDPETGDLYVGDYSPDADKPDPLRGPAGHGRWIIVKKPANYGWPYCATPTQAYNDYDFATKTSGPKFNCKAPKNDSPYNTGLTTLPAVERPDIWYSYILSPHFPQLEVEGPEGNDGIAPMGGPAYVPIRGNRSPFRFPDRYAGKPLFYEWARDWTKMVELNKQGRQREIDGFAPFVDNPMDMEWGPDGTLYVLEYGDGYFAENPDAQLSKINYVRGNRSPVAKAFASTKGGRGPLAVQFSSEGTTDPDGDELTYAWDFDADGKVDSRAAHPNFTYTKNGEFRATLKVTDETDRTASAEVQIVIGNQRPVLELITSPKPDDPATPFQFGTTITYEVKVTDDAPVDCAKVTVAYILGHERHGHPQNSTAGCTGSITVPLDAGHAGAANLSAILGASYTDAGAEGQPGLNGNTQVRFTPPAPPHGN